MKENRRPPAAHVAWNAVAARDPWFDGRFVYAVSSTNVYCRPSCPARRPARNRTAFFASPAEAEAAGYRACLRCRPGSRESSRIEGIIAATRRYLDTHADEPLSLKDLAGRAGLSPFHLQRMFRRLIGLSPKAYQDGVRWRQFSTAVKNGATVTRALYEAGFGSSSRLYERASAELGMAPSAVGRGGAGVTLRYTTVPTEFGPLCVAASDRGLVAVRFERRAAALAALKREYPNARLRADQRGLLPEVRSLLECLRGGRPDLRLDLRGTSFQRKVWAALQQIPWGSVRTYSEVARSIGQPGAARAVARACAANRLALAVPCHRVVRADGRLAGYRWGVQRKRRLLACEASHPR